MRYHYVEQTLVGQFGIIEPEFVIRCSLLAKKIAGGHAHGGDQLDKLFSSRRRLQIFDGLRLFAGVADRGQRVAGAPQTGL